MLKTASLLACAVLLGISAAASGQDARHLVQQAVKTELAAGAADRTATGFGRRAGRPAALDRDRCRGCARGARNCVRAR